MDTTNSYNSILKAVDFEHLSSEEQETFLLELNSLIFRGAVVRTVESMDPSTRAAWHDLLASGAAPETLQRFLERKAPQTELALAETVETLASDILAVTSR